MFCGPGCKALALAADPPSWKRRRGRFDRGNLRQFPMLRTLDRYLIKEIVPPFLLALAVFTFILQLPPIMDQAESLIAKGVAWPTVGHLLLLLIPQALGLTIPMALLVGLLIAFGRLSGDRETVAMLACGVSLYRFLLPVFLLAVPAAGVTMWVLIEG